MLKNKKGKNTEIEPIDDVRNFDFPEGFGSVFIQFENDAEALLAKQSIHMTKYDNKLV